MAPAVSPTQRTARPANRLLAALSDVEFARLRPYLTTVSASPHDRLHRSHEPIRYVYFPNGGVYSVVTVLSTGAHVEALAVGDEGLLGIEAFFTTRPHAAGDTVFRVPAGDDTLARLEVSSFRREIAHHGSLHEGVASYIGDVFSGIVQSLACNAVHDLQQRACRWLLETERRAHSSTFALTQELVASMLGARRSSITGIARDLQDAGLIRCGRGRITVIDRRGLEARACECYSVLYERQSGSR